MPPTYRSAFRAELVRAFSAPFEAPIVVTVNAVLVSVAWFFLPIPLQDLLFTLHGELAFPLALATWMLADVPATNVLGSDAVRARSALDDPDALKRLLYAKNAVLWLLVAPASALVALGIGFARSDWATTTVTIIGILVVPIGSLGIAAWLGIWFPYHTLSLADRWAHRRPAGRMLVRWLVLATLPYAVVPTLTGALAAPALLTWVLVSGQWRTRIPEGDLAIGVAITVVLSVAAFVIGHRIGRSFIARRRDELRAYLAAPELG